MSATRTATKSTSTNGKTYDGFTDDERAAMKERAKELKAAGRRSPGATQPDEEEAVLAKLAEMTESDRALGEWLHAIIKASVPALTSRLWYGMPAYAKDGKMVCFFQCAQKFKSRYATLGFSDQANLDEGTMWPTTYALTAMTADDEARISELLRQATR